jgi:hypothetical protein
VQAASNNTIKGGLTAPDEPTDRQSLVEACTGGLLQASGQANSPALQAGVSISAADAAAHLSSNSPEGSDTNRIHEGPPRAIVPRGLTAPTAAGSSPGAQMLRLYQPEVDEFQVGAWLRCQHSMHAVGAVGAGARAGQEGRRRHAFAVLCT